jgi:hypothetical protein
MVDSRFTSDPDRLHSGPGDQTSNASPLQRLPPRRLRARRPAHPRLSAKRRPAAQKSGSPPMRFRGARDNTLAWIIGIVAVVVVIAAVWFLFIQPL